ncbi:hypothetical protein [Methylocystis parvus]|uniref:Uncharacterized protein n=1 Tax=Methylocystis parvus TaxID=134 RepID=A0A6B8LWV5_9HYPH|nr:hypothetical protein [Methylocystis parvus]QGM96867.1 hypothetical protein F7D14_04850 [Methylocystis parvus]WBJ99251.1 hypothetical protein MMG94_14770 [Methylocystis parvus OBBP]
MAWRNSIAFLIALFCFAPLDASAGNSTGPAALALAALAAESSPLVNVQDKRLLAAYLNGAANAPYAKSKRIEVKADAVDCRASNVDIAMHACTLSFGARKIELQGRRAHELYATLIENGVPADGAAGSIHEAVTELACEVDAAEVAQKAGGGARCAFKP